MWAVNPKLCDRINYRADKNGVTSTERGRTPILFDRQRPEQPDDNRYSPLLATARSLLPKWVTIQRRLSV